MITIDMSRGQIMCLSTDTKPTEDIPVNMLCLELDTGDFYYLESLSSTTEETLFTGTATNDNDIIVSQMPSGEITVAYDGETYVCQPKTVTVQGETETYWGATVTLPPLPSEGEPEPSYDWDEYPFNLLVDGDDQLLVTLNDENDHSMTISGTVETPAVWEKVGEGSSPTPPTPTPIEGDLENGCTVQPSAWVDGEVDVPFFDMEIGQTYVLYLDGESIDNTATAQRDELTDGAYLEYEFGRGYRLSFLNTSNEDTTTVAWNISPSVAVTIRLDLFPDVSGGELVD